MKQFKIEKLEILRPFLSKKKIFTSQWDYCKSVRVGNFPYSNHIEYEIKQNSIKQVIPW